MLTKTTYVDLRYSFHITQSRLRNIIEVGREIKPRNFQKATISSLSDLNNILVPLKSEQKLKSIRETEVTSRSQFIAYSIKLLT